MPRSKERIVAAAIQFEGETYILSPPARHHDIIAHIHTQTGKTDVQGDQGFMTDKGRFVGRYEASRIAFHACQIPNCPSELFSEHLW